MNLRPNTRFKEQYLNICSNFAGLGDQISRLSAIKRIKETYVHVHTTVYWHDYFVPIAKVLVPESEMLRHKPMSEMVSANEKIPFIDFTPDTLSSLHLGLVDHAFLNILGRMPVEEDYIYPKYTPKWSRGIDIEGFGDYVVITPCFTAKNREWPGEEINRTIEGIHQTGFKTVLLGEYKPMQTGNGVKINGAIPSSLNLKLASLDLIGQTSLMDCLEIMSHAKCVVGVDNGLLHLSACTNTPSVWGFTSVEESARLPKGIKSESVIPEAECYGCQSRCFFVDHKFTECMFNDYLCTSQMTSEKFLQKIKILLDFS